jgi:hypothetical protein
MNFFSYFVTFYIPITYPKIICINDNYMFSNKKKLPVQWPRGLMGGSAAAPLLRLCFPIPQGAWICVRCECCVLSCRVLCDELITCPEELCVI